ncbi:tetratricopeptide repeat protein [Rufibacter ruber]|uniref:tetratricopeptide repeat protein n=1 Tax=Rufibacter ruber TaxID=1783499 RepID=UPI00082D86B4|nr:tetratricopeptide repeat protein [Rufibacter ruber]
MQERMFLPSKVDSSLKTQIQEISRALEKGNEEPEWFLKRARLYLAGGNQQAAFQDLSTATALNPSLGEAYFLQAKIQVARKEYQEAMKSMMQAKAFNYYTPESEAVLAQTYVGLALYEKALTPSARAVRLRPGEPTYYVLLARAQAGTGDTTRALYNLKRALQRDSTNLAAFRELSSIYTAQSRFEEAYPMVQAGVKQEPQDGIWWRRLGQVLLNQRLTDTAMATFAKAIDLEPKDAEAYAGIAEGWYKKRQYSLALENLLKAQELGLKLNDNTRWLLATCFEWTGQRELARQHYHLLVRKHPENPRYAAALQRITRPIRRTFIDTIAAKSVF